MLKKWGFFPQIMGQVIEKYDILSCCVEGKDNGHHRGKHRED